MPRLARGAIRTIRTTAPRAAPATPQQPASPPAERPDQAEHTRPQTTLDFIDAWLREPPIRRTLFAAFIATLATLIALPLTGGPLALAYLLGPLTGGTGYAAWRGRQRHHNTN